MSLHQRVGGDGLKVLSFLVFSDPQKPSTGLSSFGALGAQNTQNRHIKLT